MAPGENPFGAYRASASCDPAGMHPVDHRAMSARMTNTAKRPEPADSEAPEPEADRTVKLIRELAEKPPAKDIANVTAASQVYNANADDDASNDVTEKTPKP